MGQTRNTGFAKASEMAVRAVYDRLGYRAARELEGLAAYEAAFWDHFITRVMPTAVLAPVSPMRLPSGVFHGREGRMFAARGGKLHRLGGPALVAEDGTPRFYLDGVPMEGPQSASRRRLNELQKLADGVGEDLDALEAQLGGLPHGVYRSGLNVPVYVMGRCVLRGVAVGESGLEYLLAEHEGCCADYLSEGVPVTAEWASARADLGADIHCEIAMLETLEAVVRSLPA